MKDASLKSPLYCMLPTICYLEKIDYDDSEKISGYQGLRGRRNGLVEHRGFGGSEPIPCDITMASVHHQILVKTRGL